MTPAGLQGLRDDEGLRLSSYADPGSPLAKAMLLPASARPPGWPKLSGDPWGIGYGCTGPDIGPCTVWSKAKAEQELETRVASIECTAIYSSTGQTTFRQRSEWQAHHTCSVCSWTALEASFRR